MLNDSKSSSLLSASKGKFCLRFETSSRLIVYSKQASCASSLATMSPQGLIIIECPRLFSLPHIFPVWSATIIKHWFSIALALCIISQCSGFLSDQAATLIITCAPSFEYFLYISGNLMS